MQCEIQFQGSLYKRTALQAPTNNHTAQVYTQKKYKYMYKKYGKHVYKTIPCFYTTIT